MTHAPLNRDVEYWASCLSEVDLPGVVLTIEQIEALAVACDHIADMKSEATGQLCIPNPMRAEVDELIAKQRAAEAESEKRERLLRSVVARQAGVEPRQVLVRNGEVLIDHRI